MNFCILTNVLLSSQSIQLFNFYTFFFLAEDMPTFLKVEEEDDIPMEADIGRRLSDNNQSSSSEDEVKPKTPDVVGSCGSFKVQQNRDMPLFMTMTQAHTLCFVYLGLVYLEEPVLLNDLIR